MLRSTLLRASLLLLLAPRCGAAWQPARVRGSGVITLTPRTYLPHLCAAPPPPPPAAASKYNSGVWREQLLVMFGAAAVLGPLCDGCHSRHNVLHYETTFLAAPLHLGIEGFYQLETEWWVPLLFGVAGIILGASHPLLDVATYGRPRPPPGWRNTLLCIACFVLCYELSGVLDEAAAARALTRGAPELTERLAAIDVPLTVNALAIWAIFERTPGGAIMALATAVGGPLIEVGLINVLGLYHYSHPDLAGIPLWIPQVYAAGAPAVGNLGRQVQYELQLRSGRAVDKEPLAPM